MDLTRCDVKLPFWPGCSRGRQAAAIACSSASGCSSAREYMSCTLASCCPATSSARVSSSMAAGAARGCLHEHEHAQRLSADEQEDARPEPDAAGHETAVEAVLAKVCSDLRWDPGGLRARCTLALSNNPVCVESIRRVAEGHPHRSASRFAAETDLRMPGGWLRSRGGCAGVDSDQPSGLPCRTSSAIRRPPARPAA